MNRTPNHFVPLVYSAIATAGVLLALVGGSNVTMLIVGACVAVVAAALAAIAWRRVGPIGGTVSTGGWWKLVVAGPCIIVGVIVAAGLGVEAWFLGVILVFGAFVVTGVGLVLGLGLAWLTTSGLKVPFIVDPIACSRMPKWMLRF